MEQDLIFDDKRTFVLLVEGTLRTQLSPSEINGAYLSLETPQAMLRMYGMDGMTEARVVAARITPRRNPCIRGLWRWPHSWNVGRSMQTRPSASP
jgi:hypothetical protein